MKELAYGCNLFAHTVHFAAKEAKVKQEASLADVKEKESVL